MSTQIGWEGKRSKRITACPSRVDTEEGGFQELGDPPWTLSGSKRILGTPAWGPTLGSRGGSWCESQWDWKEGGEILDSALEDHAHACFLQGTRWRRQIETTQNSGLLPVGHPSLCSGPCRVSALVSLGLAQLPLGQGLPLLSRVCTCGDSVITASEPVRVLVEATDEQWVGAMNGVPAPPQSVPHLCQVPTLAPLASALLPSGVKAPTPGQG